MATSDDPVIFRPARPEDIKEILEFSQELFKGRDVFQYMYMNYLSSPDVIHTVAVVQGKVVSFVGMLVCDNGTTGQFIMGRTMRQYTRRNILHQMVSDMSEEAERKWPQLKRLRMSSYNPEKAKLRTDFEYIGCRTLLQICYEVPVGTIIKIIQKETTSQKQDNLHRLYKNNLLEALQTVPDDIDFNPKWLLVDSFLFNAQYSQNVDMIFGQVIAGGRVCVNATKTTDGRLQSISFAQPIPITTRQEILRINIDYYGKADVNLVKRHTIQQLQTVLKPGNMFHFPNVTKVNAQLFLPNEVLGTNISNLQDYFSNTLGFVNGGQFVLEQSYGNIRVDLYDMENQRRSENRKKKLSQL